MRTTLNLPNDLIKQAQRILGTKTKTETILAGLQQILRTEKIHGLLALRGKRRLNIDLQKSRKRA